MSVVDDLRKLIQDLVTPEVRAIAAELKMHREETNRRLDELTRRLDKSVDDLRGDIRTQVQSVVVQITGYLRIEQRLSAVEDRQQHKELPEQGQQ